MRAWLARLWPAPLSIDIRERWRLVLGAGIGVLLAALCSRWLAGSQPAGPWLVAPLGASALLVFGVPASPFAQPWTVLAGNTLSALVGIACATAIPDIAIASAACVVAAIALMLALRCLHPPGGASALLMVLTHTTTPHAALFPVFVNSLLLVLAGVAYNSATGRPYPHAQRALPPAPSGKPPPFAGADIEAALAHYNQLLDVSRDDLQAIFALAEAKAYQRNFGQLHCAEVMTREPIAVQYGTPLLEAWALMREHHVKALPVVDRVRRIVGIVTTADFMRLAGLHAPRGIGARLRALVRPSGRTHTKRPEAVGQIMTRQVRVASQDVPLADLVPLFSSSGHHHIPIIDGEQRLVGILTQTDLVRALHRALQAGSGSA